MLEPTRIEVANVVPTVIVTGPVGVGKTSTARAIADRLRAAGVPHAMIDLDAIVECYPAPPDDPFNFRLAMRNLAVLWRNFHDAGARYLVLNWVVEARDELDGYRDAVPGADIRVARLRAPLTTIHARIRQRAGGGDVTWELNRARQLAEEMDETALEDLCVETEGRDADAVARVILGALGWPGGATRDGWSSGPEVSPNGR